LGNSLLTAQLAASEEGLSPIELIGSFPSPFLETLVTGLINTGFLDFVHRPEFYN
jgi:hypothetical protein